MKQNDTHGAAANRHDPDEALRRLARELHVALFPEEYDRIYDSVSDAKDRRQGKNPMNAAHIEKTNARRALLGFGLFEVGPGSLNENTLAWVLKKLSRGEESELQDLVTTRAGEDSEAELKKEQARQQLQTPSWLDQRIDEMLTSGDFSYDGQDRTDPNVIAFRILGELFNVNMAGNNEPGFLMQIRRLVPNRSEAEYQDLYRLATKEWMEAYGY